MPRVGEKDTFFIHQSIGSWPNLLFDEFGPSQFGVSLFTFMCLAISTQYPIFKGLLDTLLLWAFLVFFLNNSDFRRLAILHSSNKSKSRFQSHCTSRLQPWEVRLRLEQQLQIHKQVRRLSFKWDPQSKFELTTCQSLDRQPICQIFPPDFSLRLTKLICWQLRLNHFLEDGLPKIFGV